LCGGAVGFATGFRCCGAKRWGRPVTSEFKAAIALFGLFLNPWAQLKATDHELSVHFSLSLGISFLTESTI
jgi:hypothetical protein